MTSPELVVLLASPATDLAGAAAIDAVIRRRRAELARVALSARTARTRCEQVEAKLRSDRDGRPTGGGPEDLLDVVDAMLEKAMGAAVAAVESARRQAVSTIALALEVGATELMAVGVDPATVPLGSGSRVRPRDFPAPRTAAQLWNEVRVEASPPVIPPGLTRRPSGASRPGSAPASPSAELGRLLEGAVASPDLAAHHAGQLELGERAAGVATLVLGEPETAPATDGQVFELFWEQLPTERRVRSRLRRRAGREGM